MESCFTSERRNIRLFFYVDERGFCPQSESDYFTCDTDCLPMWSIPYSQVVEENDYEN